MKEFETGYPSGAQYWVPHIRRVAAEEGVPFELLNAIIRRESNYHPGAIGDRGNALGLGQLWEPAARDVGLTSEERRDPMKNLRGTAKYLRSNLRQFNGDLIQAGVAFNVGPGALKKNPNLHGHRAPDGTYREYLMRTLGGNRRVDVSSIPTAAVSSTSPSIVSSAAPSIAPGVSPAFTPVRVSPSPSQMAPGVVTLGQLLPRAPKPSMQQEHRQPVGDTFSSLFLGRRPRY